MGWNRNFVISATKEKGGTRSLEFHDRSNNRAQCNLVERNDGMEICWEKCYAEMARRHVGKKVDGRPRAARYFFDFAEVLQFRRACNWMQSCAGIDTSVVPLVYRAQASPLEVAMLMRWTRRMKWSGDYAFYSIHQHVISGFSTGQFIIALCWNLKQFVLKPSLNTTPFLTILY